MQKPCLYVKSFKSQHDTESENIRKVFKQARQSAPCILVLEYLDSLQLKRLVAIAKPENFASRRVMEKIGMQYEKNIHLYGVEWVLYKINNS